MAPQDARQPTYRNFGVPSGASGGLNLRPEVTGVPHVAPFRSRIVFVPLPVCDSIRKPGARVTGRLARAANGKFPG